MGSNDSVAVASGVTEFAIAGNGDLIMLINRTVYDQWNPREPMDSMDSILVNGGAAGQTPPVPPRSRRPATVT